MQNNNLVDTRQAFKYLWLVWRLTGIECPISVKRRYYYLYAIILNLSVTILFPLTFFINLFFTHNMAQLYENLVISITDIIANFKFAYVWYSRSKLRHIKEILEQLDLRAKGKGEQLILRDAVRTALHTFYTFSILHLCGIMLSVNKLLFTKERSLLYPAWFYVDWQQSYEIYIFVLLYQFVGLTIQAVQNSNNCSYPPVYLCILTAHMRTLELRVRRLGVQVNDNCSKQMTQHQLNFNYEELLSCINDHILILRLYYIINDILSVSCLVQFIFTTVMECCLGLHFLYLADVNDLFAQLLSIIFVIVITLEAFVLCYFGDIMREQSAALTNAFYSCNWPEQQPRFKRVLLIALLRSQRECVIRAGNYISVDLDSFLKLNKYAYSAFTLLIRLK